jgi:hypothetical protein
MRFGREVLGRLGCRHYRGYFIVAYAGTLQFVCCLG